MSCRKSIIVINVGINGKDMKQLVVLLFIAVAGIASISCNGKKKDQGQIVHDNVGLNLSHVDSYHVYLKYRQKIEGYQVIVDFSPRTSITHGQCCTELYMGKAILNFSKENSSFSVESEEFSDSSLICYVNSDKEYVPKNDKSIDLSKIASGDTIEIDYLPPKDQEYLSWNSPFYFLDMNFDGKKDLVINNMGCGYYGGNTYDVFSLSDSTPTRLVGYPFEQDGIKLNSDCEYNPVKKELILKVKDGVKMENVEQDSQFDGDPQISGSTSNITAIMKSIAEGDARKLASLCSFPLERKYPLHDIVNSSDLRRRFNQVFDNDFRDRMKKSKPSDWHSYGWRGYHYGEDYLLWVYDSLYVIDYYSPQEKNLYEQLVKKEMGSLHESMRGQGWHPFACFKDKTDGSIIRVDIKDRKTKRKENFHVDPVALTYPQLQPFKLRGDEEFRLAIYPKGSNLGGKPQMLLEGYVEVGGSANYMDYIFKNNNGMEMRFGDNFFEDGKRLLNRKNGNEESSHEITPCYWLDLNK